MSNIYDMSGKKKVIFTENLETNITYKEIRKIVIENALRLRIKTQKRKEKEKDGI